VDHPAVATRISSIPVMRPSRLWETGCDIRYSLAGRLRAMNSISDGWILARNSGSNPG
jgi:hypothetical protein